MYQFKFCSLKCFHVYVCAFSTLKSPRVPFSTFLVISNPLCSKVRVAEVSRASCLRTLVFHEAESSLHFVIKDHKFFSGVVAIMNLKPFDVMVDSKLLLDCIFCLFYFLLYMLQNKYDSTNIKISCHIFLHILGKKDKRKIGTNLSKNNYIAAKKQEKRSCIFPFSKFGFGSQSRLLDVISVTMTSSSKFKQYFEEANLNPVQCEAS